MKSIKKHLNVIMIGIVTFLTATHDSYAQHNKDIANDYFRQGEQSDYGTQNDNPLTFDLSGHLWKIQGALPGRGMEERFPDISYDHMGDALNWAPAHVPGDVFSDLWRIGRIDDPHFGRNSTRAKWVNEYEWWYLRIFNVPKEMKGKNVEITFDGVDYACDVFLNGELLGSHEGMFTSFSFDITDLISYEHKRRGRNVLAVRLHPAPRRYSQVAGRKPAWHGDYWVDLVPTGIWKPVRLEAYEKAKVKDIYVQTVPGKNETADLDIQLEVENPGNTATTVDFEIDVQGENFKSKTFKSTLQKTLKPGINLIKTNIKVSEARLWYPWDLGDQNLYLAKVKLKDSQKKVLHTDEKLFGIREIKMEMNPGYTKDEVENPWTVMINGKRHYITFAPDMKWGIVDYYQKPKISYDYVKNAFQPLLVSLQHDRRRWLPGEQFEGKIWVVNDFYKSFKGCKAEVIFLDDSRKEVSRESFKLGNIDEDSSKEYATVNCKVPGKLGDKFYVKLEMRDKSGTLISENDYLLLVADEKVDLPRLREIGKEAINKKEKYGPHNYFRYYEGLNGTRGVKTQDEAMPVVKEFGGSD